MEKEFQSTEFYQSENIEDIEKEMNKLRALHALFPHSIGSKDVTNYVLLNDNKPEKVRTLSSTDSNSSSVVNNKNLLQKQESNNINSSYNLGNNEKGLNFDPWQREKTIDRMRVIKYPRLNGEFGTQILNRAPYHEDELDYMNNAKFDSVIGNTLKSEGGYSNHPLDRGGETNYGITKSFMEDYKYALPGGKSKPIRDLTVDDARSLYKAMWDKYKLGYIRDKNLAYVMNDYMINSYAHTVIKRIQEILNRNGASLKADGLMGPMTLDAIHNCDPQWLIDEIIKNRYNHYRDDVQRNPLQRNFYKGWIKRLNGVAEKVGSKIRYPIEY